MAILEILNKTAFINSDLISDIKRDNSNLDRPVWILSMASGKEFVLTSDEWIELQHRLIPLIPAGFKFQ